MGWKIENRRQHEVTMRHAVSRPTDPLLVECVNLKFRFYYRDFSCDSFFRKRNFKSRISPLWFLLIQYRHRVYLEIKNMRKILNLIGTELLLYNLFTIRSHRASTYWTPRNNETKNVTRVRKLGLEIRISTGIGVGGRNMAIMKLNERYPCAKNHVWKLDCSVRLVC